MGKLIETPLMMLRACPSALQFYHEGDCPDQGTVWHDRTGLGYITAPAGQTFIRTANGVGVSASGSCTYTGTMPSIPAGKYLCAIASGIPSATAHAIVLEWGDVAVGDAWHTNSTVFFGGVQYLNVVPINYRIGTQQGITRPTGLVQAGGIQVDFADNPALQMRAQVCSDGNNVVNTWSADGVTEYADTGVICTAPVTAGATLIPGASFRALPFEAVSPGGIHLYASFLFDAPITAADFLAGVNELYDNPSRIPDVFRQ